MRFVRYLSYLILLLVSAGVVLAEPTGRIRGVVKDAEGKPIDKVTITIVATGEKSQKYSTTTNAKGEYVHIGLMPSDYRVTPSKDGYTAIDYGYVDLHISPSEKATEVDFKMQPAQKAQQGQPGQP